MVWQTFCFCVMLYGGTWVSDLIYLFIFFFIFCNLFNSFYRSVFINYFNFIFLQLTKKILWEKTL